MNEHYDKYKETIKKVARRHRLLKDKWIADYLMSNSCSHCGESELICLQFYPDDRKIRALSKKSEDKTEVQKFGGEQLGRRRRDDYTDGEPRIPVPQQTP